MVDLLRIAALATLLAWAFPVGAQDTGPCNTANVLGRCDAKIDAADDALVLRTDRTCAIVVWRLDGEARSTTIVDGLQRIEQPPEAAKPEVESCTAVEDFRVDTQCERALARLASARRDVNSTGVLGGDTTELARDRYNALLRRLPSNCCPPDLTCGDSAAAPPGVRAEPVTPRDPDAD